MDNATLDEVTTMMTDFNPNLTKFYPTLAVVITSILDDGEVKKFINCLEILFTYVITIVIVNSHTHELYSVYYKFR